MDLVRRNTLLQFAVNQVNKKEVLPTWVKPPSLHCKDNTILSEMQMP